MDRDYFGTRRPASDTDGSDVFLDLAQSDDETEQPKSRLSHRPGDITLEQDDDLDNTLRNLPGQFPERPPQTSEKARRPRSSGYQTIAPAATAEAKRAQHTRHVSQPNGPSGYLNNVSAMRSNRITSPRATDYTSRYVDPYNQSSPSTETPRLRRQRRLYAEHDGPTEERRSTINGGEYLRSLRRPSLPPSSPLQPSPSSAANNGIPNDSDSVDSQTAASTVWDELDDLKSRIRKLEGSAKIPATSNAAIARHTSARPETATTAPTTVSSSPQHHRKQTITSAQSTVGEALPSDMHPTLRSALQRAQTSLKPHLFRPLEAAVSDSLALASATAKPGTSSMMSSAASVANGYNAPDRQTRRKVDSLCRNLTDLCIAMCDASNEEIRIASSPTSARKPSSPRTFGPSAPQRDDEGTPSYAMHSRRGSIAARTRIDGYRSTRRSSLSTRTDLLNDAVETEPSPSTTARDYTARYNGVNRPSSQHYDDQRLSAAEPTDEQISMRAPSRAMTELGTARNNFNVKKDHLRSGIGTQRSPSLRETLEARRRSANMGDQLGPGDSLSNVGAVPARQSPAPSRFLDRIRGPESVVSGVSSVERRASTRQEPGTYLNSPRLSTPLALARSNSKGRRFVTE